MVQTITPGEYFTGGNSGWNSWSIAAVYGLFQDIFDADSTLYNLTYPLDPLMVDNLTSPQNVSGLIKAALKYGSYKAIDTTSNHLAMNSVARFLTEYAMPGQCRFNYSGGEGAGNFGEYRQQSIAQQIPSQGFGEYGSPNYGPYNFMTLLSVAILDPARVVNLSGYYFKTNMTNLVSLANSSFISALLQSGIHWFKGNWAMACGRGYPITGSWGPSDSTLVDWVLYGGDYPKTIPLGSMPPFRFSGSVKSTGLALAIAVWKGYQIPDTIVLAGAAPLPRRVKSYFSFNHQSGYVTQNYSHYSEIGKTLAAGLLEIKSSISLQHHWTSSI
jgi:hypothetical protein